MKRLTTPVVALLFLVLAAAYWQIDVLGAATGVVTPFSSEDLYVLYYPLIHYGVGVIKALHIPLWNPYQSLGAPFLGSALFGLFSPFSFLYYILPTHLAMGYSTVLNIALAGLFTFLFLNKSLKIEAAGAVTGGLVFMFSGPLLLEITHPSLLGAMAFLPLMLFLTQKVFRTVEGRWAVFFGLALACQMLTGAIQIIVHTLFMTGAFAAALLWLEWRDGKANLRPIFLLLIGVAVAVVLSSPQWLPLMELSELTGRAEGGLSLKDAEPFKDSFSFTPWIVSKGILFGGRGLYIGFLPVLISFLAPFNRRVRPYAIFFAIMAVVALLLALGTSTPLYGLYYHYIPTGKMFRIPVRWLWLTGFSISILSALGSHKILNALEGNRGLRTMLIVTIPFIITAFLFHKNVMKFYNHPQKTPEIFAAHAKEGAFLREVQGTSRTYITSNFGFDFSLLQKFGTLEKVFVLNDYESLSLEGYKKFISAMLREPDIREKKIFYGTYALGGRKKDRRLLDLLSVRFIMEKGTRYFSTRQPPWMQKIYENNGLVIYENKGALPRAYVVYNSETITGEDEALERVASPSFNPRSTVILDRDAELGRRHNIPLTEAEITNFSPEKIELTAVLPQKGVLVLTDFFYPGWKAYVDGEERPIIRANTIMRGLVLEKGTHKVEFVYRPRPFLVGFWSCMLTLSGLIIYLGVDMKKRKRAGRPL